MRLMEITQDDHEMGQPLERDVEAKFDAALHELDSGNWPGAFGIFDELRKTQLPPDFAKLARTMAGILDPNNSPRETAEGILAFMPGTLVKVYDDKRGWNRAAVDRLSVR